MSRYYPIDDNTGSIQELVEKYKELQAKLVRYENILRHIGAMEADEEFPATRISKVSKLSRQALKEEGV